MAGLIHPSKGQLEAVRALARLHASHPSARLVIAGDGRADALRQLITSLGLSDRVELTGFVQNMAPLLRRAHALLNCSRNEAMGRITVEAMASGLPVIGHDSGGTPELIMHERNGLLYPGGDEALAERMTELAGNLERAQALGNQALRDAADRFSVERYAEEVLEVYRSVLSQATA
jgi:glycosyltransferase involved in cell wall biosynthesis